MKTKTKKAQRYEAMKLAQEQAKNQLIAMLKQFEPNDIIELLYEACNKDEEKNFNEAIENHIQIYTSYNLVKTKTVREQSMFEELAGKLFPSLNDNSANVLLNL